MKGKLLSIEEVKKLKNGIKVWLEKGKDLDYSYDRESKVYEIKGEQFYCENESGVNIWTDGLAVSDENIKVYEWKEDIKMERLEIELFRYENLVFGKVLKMDEGLRKASLLAEKKGFTVESSSYPALSSDILYIRGDQKDKDEKIFSREYNDVKEAIKACENIKELVDKINSVKKVESDFGIIQIL